MELKQLLQLKIKGESNRSCEKMMGIHRNTINHYVRLFKASGIDYELLLNYDNKSLSFRKFATCGPSTQSPRSRKFTTCGHPPLSVIPHFLSFPDTAPFGRHRTSKVSLVF